MEQLKTDDVATSTDTLLEETLKKYDSAESSYEMFNCSHNRYKETTNSEVILERIRAGITFDTLFLRTPETPWYRVDEFSKLIISWHQYWKQIDTTVTMIKNHYDTLLALMLGVIGSAKRAKLAQKIKPTAERSHITAYLSMALWSALIGVFMTSILRLNPSRIVDKRLITAS